MRRFLGAFAVCFILFAVGLAYGQYPNLQVGDWVVAEDWHNWIGTDREGSHVRAYIPPIGMEDEVYMVEFYYTLDDVEYNLFGVDEDGSEPWLNTYGPIIDPPGDGWHAWFPHYLLPPSSPWAVHFVAVAYHYAGPPIEIDTYKMRLWSSP